MALQVALENSDVGVSFPNSYARINGFRGDNKVIVFIVSWYVDQEARLDGKKAIHAQEFIIDTPDIQGTLLPSLYSWLKTQSEFVGAADV